MAATFERVVLSDRSRVLTLAATQPLTLALVLGSGNGFSRLGASRLPSDRRDSVAEDGSSESESGASDAGGRSDSGSAGLQPSKPKQRKPRQGTNAGVGERREQERGDEITIDDREDKRRRKLQLTLQEGHNYILHLFMETREKREELFETILGQAKEFRRLRRALANSQDEFDRYANPARTPRLRTKPFP